MNSIVSSVRIRALRCPLESVVLRKKTLHPCPHKNHSIGCVRLASTKTKSGLLTRLRNIFNRTADERIPMSPRIRSVMDLAPRGSQPPIREPNMPEKRDRKDDKKEKKDKKPVLQTETKEEPVYKNQWGVRVPDDNPEHREKSPNYVVAHKWGVNMTKYEDSKASPANKNTSTAIPVNQNFQTSDKTNMKARAAEAISQSATSSLPSSASTLESPRSSITKTPSDEPSSRVIQIGIQSSSSSATLELPQSLPSKQSNDQEIAHQNKKISVSSGVDLSSGTIVPGDDDYNIPKEILDGSEVSAWRDVVIRSKLHEEELARRAAMAAELSSNRVESIFIRPEPPQPKLDVQVVGSVSDIGNSEQNVAKSSEAQLSATGMNLSATKKFHTCTIACQRLPSIFHRNIIANFSSTSSGDGNDFQSFPPEPEDASKAESDETKKVQPSQEICTSTKLEEDWSSVLKDLSQREMEVLLSYKLHNSEETGSCPTLPTSVTISTFPPGSNKDTTECTELNENENETSSAHNTNDSTGISELEKTILKLKESDEDGKEIKDKKGNKDDDYIRIPGDPYPYSREHYEKWRVPHGKCPIVNDDVPKAKPAETSDSPRTSKSATSTVSDVQANTKKYSWFLVKRGENDRKSPKRVTLFGAEQPAERVQTIHPDMEPPKRDVVDDLTPKDQASKFVENPKLIDVKNAVPIASENSSEDIESMKRRRRSGDDKVEASRVYELKNYAYIRPEYIKDPIVHRSASKKTNDSSTVESVP